MHKVLILNGPNLNLLGTREPDHYGHDTLANITERAVELGRSLALSVSAFQSNAEHELVERVHRAGQDGVDCVVINPAALTHSSVALRDALLGTAIPFIEVHLSNVHARESFRHHSYFSDVAVGCITGLGPQGYELAIHAAAKLLQERNT